MTLFIEIGQIAQVVAQTCIGDSKTFQKSIHLVSKFDLMMLHKTLEQKEGRKQARQTMKSILLEITKAKIAGLICDCEATEFALPTPKLTLGELRIILSKFTIEERRLIVFALAVGKSLTECSFIQHREVKKESNINKWSPEVRRFISSIPRHITCPFVFWELDNRKQATAMVGFEAKFRSVTKASWMTFAGLCSELIPVDSHEDAKEFATMFVLEAAQA